MTASPLPKVIPLPIGNLSEPYFDATPYKNRVLIQTGSSTSAGRVGVIVDNYTFGNAASNVMTEKTTYPAHIKIAFIFGAVSFALSLMLGVIYLIYPNHILADLGLLVFIGFGMSMTYSLQKAKVYAEKPR